MSGLQVCLVHPRYPGNVGATARAMKNFGFRRLVLVSDRDPRRLPEAAWLAHGAEDVLGGARWVTRLEEALESVDLVIGTTSRRGRRWRDAVEPEEIGKILAAGWARRPVSLLFGPEDRGLSVEQFSRCRWVVRLPTHAACPSMNLSHAVAVCCYALGRCGQPGPGRAPDPAAPPEELRRFLHAVEGFLERTGFSSDDGLQGGNARSRLFRFLVRAAPEGQELKLLWKLLRRVEWHLRGSEGAVPLPSTDP